MSTGERILPVHGNINTDDVLYKWTNAPLQFINNPVDVVPIMGPVQFEPRAAYRNSPIVLGDGSLYLDDVDDQGNDGIEPYIEENLRYNTYPERNTKRVRIQEPFAAQFAPFRLYLKREHYLAINLAFRAKVLITEHYYCAAYGEPQGETIFGMQTPRLVAWVTNAGQSFTVDFSGYLSIPTSDPPYNGWMCGNGMGVQCCPTTFSFSATFTSAFTNPPYNTNLKLNTIMTCSYRQYSGTGTTIITSGTGGVTRSAGAQQCCDPRPPYGAHLSSAMFSLQYSAGSTGETVTVFDAR